MTTRISRETMLMEMAHVAAKRGTCGRLAVGCIIAIDARPISLGYVGPPSGALHCQEFGCDLTQPCIRTQHAEHNAIDFAKEHRIDITFADMFCTDSPCANCALEILEAKIKRVYFDREYRAQSIQMLLDNHVEVYRLLANGMQRRIRVI